MNSVAHHVGRLIEIRIGARLTTPAEVDRFLYAVHVEGCKSAPENQPIGNGRLVTVADWRRCPVLDSDVADHLMARMTANNRVVLRSAALAAIDSPSAKMQFLRMCANRNSPARSCSG